MKLLNLIFLFLVIASLSSCESCKRGTNVDVPGGKGGKGALRVTMVHHEWKIDTAGIVYMAYGMDAPADGKYADSAKCVNENGQHVATFSNLRAGKYYLSGKGFDKSKGEMITGGNGYILRKETTIDYILGISTHFSPE